MMRHGEARILYRLDSLTDQVMRTLDQSSLFLSDYTRSKFVFQGQNIVNMIYMRCNRYDKKIFS